MPLLPLPLLRLLEGLIALLFLGAAFGSLLLLLAGPETIVNELFARRLQQMLAEDDPAFENWDQDATAVEQAYDLQDPGEVGTTLVERAAEVAAVYSAVADDQWQRTGRRSDGSVFTVETLGIYHLHDVVHHLWDITRSAEPSAVPPGDL